MHIGVDIRPYRGDPIEPANGFALAAPRQRRRSAGPRGKRRIVFKFYPKQRSRSQSKGERVNKTELIEEIAGRTDSSKAEAQRYVDTFEKVVTEVLKSGEEVQITGFGKFYVREQRA